MTKRRADLFRQLHERGTHEALLDAMTDLEAVRWCAAGSSSIYGWSSGPPEVESGGNGAIRMAGACRSVAHDWKMPVTFEIGTSRSVPRSGPERQGHSHPRWRSFEPP
jgi:hypothetical protein